MKSPLLYILEVLFCSGLLLAFYRLLLVRKVSFRACRRYLVAAVFLSAVIPALDTNTFSIFFPSSSAPKVLLLQSQPS